MILPVHHAEPLLHNRVLWATAAGWVVAQSIKVFLAVRQKHRFDIRWFLGTGGMPSAHSAGVSSLVVAVGLEQGFHSPIFAIALIFALVTMFDAQGVRRATGRQGMAFNKLIDDLYAKGQVSQERVMEVLGHTPTEVFVGALLGGLIAMALYRF